MKTIYVTINEDELDVNCTIEEFQTEVEKRMSGYEFTWTVNKNTVGSTQRSECIDDNGNEYDIENELKHVMERVLNDLG